MTDGTDDAHVHRPAHDHDHDDAPRMLQTGIEVFGVGLAIAAPADVFPRLSAILPPGWREKEPGADDEYFWLEPMENAVYRVMHGTAEEGRDAVSGSSDLQIALEVLDTMMRAHIAFRAPDHIFVHAGVVGYGGRAIVIPGSSFSGKTTLVAELVRAGAVYYSDEYAVLDEAGMVHPYPKPLSLRSGGLSQADHAVETIGGEPGVEPLPVGLVVAASYLPDAEWDPRRLSSGEAVLAVLENTIPAQDRPDQVMSTLTKAINGAVVLQGDRGEASAIVPDLLTTLPD